jgi:hypothetical protein
MTTTRRAPVAAKKKGEKVKDDFVTELAGVEVRLPSLAFLRPGLVRQVRRMGQADAMFTLFELCLSKAALDEVDKLDADEFDDFCKEWNEHSGVSLGES